MRGFVDDIKSRYEQRATSPTFNPTPLTVLAEEMTGWGSECQATGRFMKSCLSDTRKILFHLISVSHGRELGCLGNIEGLSALRDSGFLEINLQSEPDPNNQGKSRPTGLALVQLPGKKKEPPQMVRIPRLDIEAISKGSTRVQPAHNPNPTRMGEPTVNSEVHGDSLEFVNPQNAPDRAQLARKLGATKEEILGLLFGATKGGTVGWEMACQWYRENLGK
jgi:hypothetical protein